MPSKLDSATAAAIVKDVADNVPAASSTVTYGPEETRFREAVELEWEAWHKRNPDAHLDIPMPVVY